MVKRKTSVKHDAKRAEDLVMKMMAIEGPPGKESRVVEFIIGELMAAGLKKSAISRDSAQKKSYLGGECGNLIVKLPASKTFKGVGRRLLSAHMDTVPLCVGSRPKKTGNLVKSADKRTALGGDNRSGCAVLLSTLLTILDKELEHPPLTFLFTAQEEVGLKGAQHVTVSKLGPAGTGSAKKGKKRGNLPVMGFNFDGARPEELVVGATGAYRMAIEIQGLASHAGGHPEDGISAISVASLAIADLHIEGWHGLVERGGPGGVLRGTSNVGVIEGGHATNVVTDHVRIRAEARSHDRKFRKTIVEAYKKAFLKAAREVKNDAGRTAKVKFEVRHDYESYRIDTEDEVVQIAAAAARAAGKEPTFRVVNGGLDSNMLNQHGIPTVSLGAGQRGIHTVKEHLKLNEFQRACAIGLNLATANPA